MSSTLYVGTYTPRGLIVKDLAKYLKLDVKIVEDKESDKKYVENFPLNKVPAFIGKNGFKLTETIAIAYYCMFSDKLKLFFDLCASISWWESFQYHTVIPVWMGTNGNNSYVDNIYSENLIVLERKKVRFISLVTFY